MCKYHVYRSLQINQQLLNTRLHLCRVSKTNINNNTSTLYCQIFNLEIYLQKVAQRDII